MLTEEVELGIREQIVAALSPVIDRKLQAGLVSARDNVAIDTSSLKTDIRLYEAELEGDLLIGELVVGGGDYRNQILPETGKKGRKVDYAVAQNEATRFMDIAEGTIRNTRSITQP
jgi:hypothetical protein